MFRPIPIVALIFLAGCAQYEFDLTHPPELARHVTAKEPTSFPRPPLEYTLQAAEGRLTMQITNPSDDPIQLLGDQSAVVDPNGQSHPLQNQAIASRSFIKLILPPLRPFYQASSSWYLGANAASIYPYGYFGPGPYPYDSYYQTDQPLYLSAQGSDPYYWSWDGQTPIRLHLTFRQANNTFSQDFAFHRRKV